LPEILAINSSLDNEKDLEFLKRQIYRKDGPTALNGDVSPPQQQSIKKPCRYGLNCSRVDCHFTHQNRKSPTSGATPAATGAQKSNETWFPLSFSMQIDADGELNVINEKYFVKEVSVVVTVEVVLMFYSPLRHEPAECTSEAKARTIPSPTTAIPRPHRRL
jgi:PAB-dependent poly(A)-specific ribonuclease subunit 2